MEELGSLYNAKVKCPVCEKVIEYTKVRSRAVKLLKQDTDFCPYYQGENPLLYEAVICSECGYGSHVTTFVNINRYEKVKVREKISSKWIKRSFTGKRDYDKALEAFKIVLLNLYEREAAKSEIAKICLRIAWIYRYKGDGNQENKFLEHALEQYKIAYHDEDLSEGKFDEYTCMFIIGELSKRLKYYNESSQWLSRLITSFSDPNQRRRISNRLIESARDMVQELKDLTAYRNKEAL